MNFYNAWLLFFHHAFTIYGRSSRSAFWWVVGSLMLLGSIASVLHSMFPVLENETNLPYGVAFFFLCCIVLIIPLLTLLARRFHDAGFHSMWILISAFTSISLYGGAMFLRETQSYTGVIVWLAESGFFLWGLLAFWLLMSVKPSKTISMYIGHPRDSFKTEM